MKIEASHMDYIVNIIPKNIAKYYTDMKGEQHYYLPVHEIPEER